MYRIMLADDNEELCWKPSKILLRLILAEGEIATAKTGRAVVELAERFDRILPLWIFRCRVVYGFCQAMKEIQKTNKNIIFIVISAY